MGEAMNYDGYAERYRHNRFAVEWLVDPLARLCQALRPGDRVLDVGCGTGNYVLALWRRFAELRFYGLDLSRGMLEQARLRAADEQDVGERSPIEWSQANADEQLPYPNGFASLVIAVDVIHHLERPAVLFSEATRLLRPGGELVVVTDSPEDLLARSLTRYFPETLEHEQQRYPAPEALDSQARDASLETLPRVTAHGELSLSPDFVAKLEDRCASALRLLSDEAHTQGIERVRKAAARGELWRSHYTLYRYRKPTPPGP